LEGSYERRNTNRHSIKPQFSFLPASSSNRTQKDLAIPKLEASKKQTVEAKGEKSLAASLTAKGKEGGTEGKGKTPRFCKKRSFSYRRRMLTSCSQIFLENIRRFMISRNRHVEATQGNLLEGKLNLKNFLSAEKAGNPECRSCKLQLLL